MATDAWHAATVRRRPGVHYCTALRHSSSAVTASPSTCAAAFALRTASLCECGGGCDHQQLAAPPCIPLWRESLCRSHYDSV